MCHSFCHTCFLTHFKTNKKKVATLILKLSSLYKSLIFQIFYKKNIYVQKSGTKYCVLSYMFECPHPCLISNPYPRISLF